MAWCREAVRCLQLQIVPPVDIRMDEGVPIIKRSNIEDRFLVKSSLNMAVTDRYISNA